MTFGEKLYQLRKGRSMSQEALAGELGVSRQAISRWELGEVLPDTASVLAVSPSSPRARTTRSAAAVISSLVNLFFGAI